MNVQVRDGLATPWPPENVPDAVNSLREHSDNPQARYFFAIDMIKNNQPLYAAIKLARKKESGHDLITGVGEAAEVLMIWAKFQDSLEKRGP